MKKLEKDTERIKYGNFSGRFQIGRYIGEAW